MGFKWSLVSIPDHLGVENVGGRLGAAFGPRAFWEVFSKMSGKTSTKAWLERQHTLAPVSSDIDENHSRAASLVEVATKEADRTVVVGGGHDHGYSQLLGIRQALGPNKRIACINIDAHLDVRKPAPKISSGSPFYLAVENKIIDPRDFVEFGIQAHCNSPELWNYASAKGIEIVEFSQCRNAQAVLNFTHSLVKLASQVDAIVVSLDLDSAAEAFAPGVSAPQAEGFTSSELVQICEVAGSNAKVLSLGLFELNPLHDLNNRTARLAATCADHFLRFAQDIRE
jgi:formimidoylglutamase